MDVLYILLLASNYFNDVREKILRENLPYNHLLVRKINAATSYNTLVTKSQNSNITPAQLFQDIIIDEFTLHSEIISKRINLYFLQIYTRYKDDGELLLTNMLEAKSMLNRFFIKNIYYQQITQMIEDIFIAFNIKQ